MADMHELEIQIDGDGNVSIKVIGAEGASCVKLTKELEEALGIVTDRKLTEDYYQEGTEEQVEQELGGGA